MVRVVIEDDRNEKTVMEGKAIVLYVHKPKAEDCDYANAVVGKGNILDLLVGAAVNLGRIIEDAYDNSYMQGLVTAAVTKALIDSIGNTELVREEGSLNTEEE